MNQENFNEYLPEGVKTIIHGNIASFEVEASHIKEMILELYSRPELTLKIITATDERKNNRGFKVWYIFGVPEKNIFIAPFITLTESTEFPSVSVEIHEAWNHERKIHSFFGLTPVGHPDLRPIILHENWPTHEFPLRKDFMWNKKVETAKGTYEFQKVSGEGIYEIPVGPIHAGIIEPGHFRFSVAGEHIMLLEARLGFVHKGSEKLFEKLPVFDKIRLSEKISGDSSFNHSLAFVQALEKLGHVEVSARAKYLRVVFAELERLANHFGDIGAIMIDTGFNFGGANGARLREMVMQLNEKLTGSRFIRGVNTIGGITKDIGEKEKKQLLLDITRIKKDFEEVIAVAENSASLLNRLKGTGVITPEIVADLGVVGVPARATGFVCDARRDYSYAAYKELAFNEVATEKDGDVFARFYVRIKEVRTTLALIEKALNALPSGKINGGNTNIVFDKNSFAVGVVEGWRGDMFYFVTTDEQGNISRVALRDPSFLNWSAVGVSGYNNVVPDFPLINKSFNLSYSGNDV